MSIQLRYDTGLLIDWVRDNYPQFLPDVADTHALGVEVDGEIQAVAMYNNFTTTNCAMHVVSNGGRRWASRTFLSAAFAYPFVQVGVHRVTALVPAGNVPAITLDLRLGFRIEGVMREAEHGGEDLVVLGMLRRNCAWITEEQRNGR